MSEGIGVRELLKNTYDTLGKRHDHVDIIFPGRVTTEIANDSDYHRTRIGYMGYESVGLFHLDSKSWAIGRGEKCGDYPADPYDSDILALEYSSPDPQKIAEEIYRNSNYFGNSLVHGMRNGSLAVSQRGRFGEKMFKILQPEIEKFIAQKPEQRSDVFVFGASGLEPATTRSTGYEKEFVDFLADAIETVLRES